MRLYLSSFKLGNRPEKLTKMASGDKRIAFIPNAMDFATDIPRLEKSIGGDIDSLKSIGLNPTIFDLKNYFDKSDSLAKEIDKYSGIFMRGGNAFVLRRAMFDSGLDKVIQDMRSNPDFVVAGYSAGPCVLSPSLKGLDLVDDPKMVNSVYQKNVIWDGLGIIDFVFVSHYQSDHPETEDINKVIKYLKTNNINYQTFRDGEVYTVSN